jgi:hypothetical protein
MEEVNETPHWTWLAIQRANWQQRWWAVQHWLAERVCGLAQCRDCGGYFDAVAMVEPGRCNVCYYRCCAEVPHD